MLFNPNDPSTFPVNFGTIPNALPLSESEKKKLDDQRIEADNNIDNRKEVAKTEGFLQYMVANNLTFPKDFLLGVKAHMSLVPNKDIQTLTDIVRFTTMTYADIQKIYFEKKYPKIQA
mgnify:CR=1 FL=1